MITATAVVPLQLGIPILAIKEPSTDNKKSEGVLLGMEALNAGEISTGFPLTGVHCPLNTVYDVTEYAEITA